ncbi:TolC family protein [Horticoccus luteus]|uniref:TolC family protein n=1 Tax=Horticoccus luteus TaxID=2862869 RepID=A0A8F9TV54_9BACT|nr:TolC family protein [Horticoccus luteus]QYM79650.1 TolC family protein [Horticoccus luteus]
MKVAAANLQHPLIRPVVIDARDGFSPDEIAVMVVITSPALRALRAQRGVARAQLLQAGLLPNPQLSASFDRVDARGDPTLVNGDSLGVSWDVTALLAHGDVKAAARATADALDLSIAWQEWQASQEARMRAFRLWSLEQRLPWARDVESDRAEALEETRRAVQQRLSPAPDLTPANDAWRRAQADRLALEQQILVDRSALNLALGQPVDEPLQLHLDDGFPALPENALAQALDGLPTRRLDLAALKLGYASQEATLRAAVKAQFPRLDVSLSRARDTSDVHTHSIGVTLDLPLFDRGQGQIAVARATRQQLFEEYVARVAEARSEVGQIIAQITATRAELGAIDATLPALEQLAASFARALAGHSVTPAAYRDARDTLATRRIEQSQLQQSLLELEVGLETVTGQPLLNRRVAAASP